MRVLFSTPEVAPLAKAGGLGDVGAALPRALVEAGHDVKVVMPAYPRVWQDNRDIKRAFDDVLSVQLGPHTVRFSVFETTITSAKVPVYLVDCPWLFGRASIYTNDADEHLRFSLLSWATLLIAQRLGFAPDIVHANDWPTALVPLLLKRAFSWDRLFDNARSVITIHNIGHQGTFASSVLPDLGLSDSSAFHQEQLAEGRVSFMLTGLLYADAITTVSPTYAREITTPEHGVGLDGFLRARHSILRGILNGIDDETWNPASDTLIPYSYSANDLTGKERNKRHLLERLGMPYQPRTPLVGLVSRLVWQKGFDLCFEALPALLRQSNAQLVVLGSGEPKYEQFFRRLAHAAPQRVSFHRGFSEPLAHLIEAGSDMFLMPSRYEPCGLNQMYSCAYGTAPIVHRTGGLGDTVKLWDRNTGEGNGFIFDHFNVAGLKWALGYAMDSYADEDGWRKLVQNAMDCDFSWRSRVREYEELYRWLGGASDNVPASRPAALSP